MPSAPSWPWTLRYWSWTRVEPRAPWPFPSSVLGIGRTSLARNEAIIGIRIPVPASPRNGFGKLGLGARREVVIANVSLTMVFDFREAEGVIAGAGSWWAPPLRGPTARRRLKTLCTGRPPSTALARELSDCLTRAVRASIGQNPLFAHKPSDVQGLALDVFQHIFADRI